MARTSQPKVKELLGADYGADANGNLPSLWPRIASATVIVDRVATCATDKGMALTSAELELIERWLAAHFHCMTDPIYQSKNTSKASAQFQGQSGMHLEQTRYGQTAMDLDWSGCLTAISKRAFAHASWLGQTVPERTDWSDRN